MKWETDPSGIPIDGWGLWMRPQDMAKLGYLYLRQGVWDGQQITPASWIKASTQPYFQIDEPLEPWELTYGYGWWLHEYDAYGAHGAGGQFITVLPNLDVVVVFTGDLLESEFIQPELLVREYVIPAVLSAPQHSNQ